MSYFPQTTRATIGRRAPQTQRRYGNGPESMLLNSHPSRRIQSTMPTTSAPEPEQYQPQDDKFDIDMSSVIARQQASKNEQRYPTKYNARNSLVSNCGSIGSISHANPEH
ncbi:hypothetical protein EDB81DRAFT_761651 [Dactylonectria macrodidyma]|uniref:Uncharacterized protein n=1 Tax=Dactylonectria macrodidyma TaxID=307937 RepID=A0A9P9EH82_9HYPO|nr:hypothetical protein EDB81DRAFT_761651 [Dactylonectria macrodidyma]